jgi:hypothetical protein
MPALKCSLFSFESAIVTDLDVALRARIPGARDVGVLVPVAVLKRCLLIREASEVRVERAPSAERPFMFAIGDAVFPGHDPANFPDVAALFHCRAKGGRSTADERGRVRDAHEPEPKCLSSTGELIDIERVTISSEGDRWKSTRWGNSLAVYPTSRAVLRGLAGAISPATRRREETYRKKPQETAR